MPADVTNPERRAASIGEVQLLVGCVTVLIAVAIGVMWLLGSDSWRRHDPIQALAQLGLFYLDEPAPALDDLGVQPGSPAVLVVCRGCEPPDVAADGQVIVTSDPAVGAAYGLATTDGRLGPGYAIIDARGQVRSDVHPYVCAHAYSHSCS